jgi:hypothetical protein
MKPAAKQVRGRGRPRGSSGKPTSERQIAANRANAAKAHITLPPDIRKALSDAKGRLGKALSDHGVGHVEQIIEDGPSSELFQWAMDFAADRGGMPRRRETEIDAAADLPPMTILFANHPKPLPGSD